MTGGLGGSTITTPVPAPYNNHHLAGGRGMHPHVTIQQQQQHRSPAMAGWATPGDAHMMDAMHRSQRLITSGVTCNASGAPRTGEDYGADSELLQQQRHSSPPAMMDGLMQQQQQQARMMLGATYREGMANGMRMMQEHMASASHHHHHHHHALHQYQQPAMSGATAAVGDGVGGGWGQGLPSQQLHHPPRQRLGNGGHGVMEPMGSFGELSNVRMSQFRDFLVSEGMAPPQPVHQPMMPTAAAPAL
jgi:hypothetical protein